MSIGGGTTEPGDPEHPFLRKLIEKESGLSKLIRNFYRSKPKEHQLFVGLARSDLGYVALLYDNQKYQRGLKFSSSSEDEHGLEFKMEPLEFARFDVFRELNMAYSYIRTCVKKFVNQGYNIVIDLDVEGAEFETIKEDVN